MKLPLATMSAITPIYASLPVHKVTDQLSAHTANHSDIPAVDFRSRLLQSQLPLSVRPQLVGGLLNKSMQTTHIYRLLQGSKSSSLTTRAKKIRENAKWLSLRSLLEDCGGDPGLAFVSLQTALKDNTRDDQDDAERHLVKLFKSLKGRYKREIRASINTAPGLFERVERPEQRQELRSMYLDIMKDTPTVFGVIGTLIKQRDGANRFGDNLNALRRMTADDLASEHPSSPHTRTLMEALAVGRYVISALDNCALVVSGTKRWNPSINITVPQFMQELLAQTSRGLTIREFYPMTKAMGGEHVRGQLSFLNLLRPMLRKLPRQLWPDAATMIKSMHNLSLIIIDLSEQDNQTVAKEGNK